MTFEERARINYDEPDAFEHDALRDDLFALREGRPITAKCYDYVQHRRCDADELTYPLHILVRYEIEQLLFSGEAKASDVPRLWAEKYKGYLGIDVPDDARGALQDTHWSDGSLGYFPTYALGSAIGAQLKDAMVASGMDFEGVCASGDLAPVREWLRSNIWRWGRSKDTDELVRAACGEPFDAKHYTDYLTQKFSAIYEL